METKSDIIAELRSVAFAMKVHDAMMPEVYDILCDVAFRLESAWKRERAEIEDIAKSKMLDGATIVDNRSVGNAAAMREALERFMVGSCTYPCVEMCGYDEIDEMCMSCAASPKKDGDCPYEAARKALSAPARNCDIAQDWLQDLYCKFKPPATVRREMPPEWVDAVMAFCKWLLAPAAERKGGRDVR